MSVAVTHAARCANCSAPLTGAFCARCGQKVAHLNPSLREFLHDLAHEILHVDGKIVRSVRLLLTRPGFLTLEHFAGRRAAYVSPLRLYLTFSVIYFAIAALGPNPFVRLAEDRANAAEAQQALNETFAHWMPRAMFVLVPVYAALVASVTRRSGLKYPQHLYFALHIHAVGFFANALSLVLRRFGPASLTEPIKVAANATFDPPLIVLPGVYLIVYMVLAFRRVYGLSRVSALVRMAVVGIAYFLATLLVLAAIVVPIIVRFARQ